MFSTFKFNLFSSANILLDQDFTAKISDFGLARASAKLAQTVMTSRIVGTTAYMAPEALRGEITPKSDIYSFGVVRDPRLCCFACISTVCVGVHAAAFAQGPEGSFREPVLSFHPVASRDQMQVARLGGKCLYLAKPSFQPTIVLFKP